MGQADKCEAEWVRIEAHLKIFLFPNSSPETVTKNKKLTEVLEQIVDSRNQRAVNAVKRPPTYKNQKK